jgi:hypothetical protein
MGEGALRGTRLGATSYENDEHVDFAARQLVTFVCPQGHSTTVPFSVEAEEIPTLWECKCGAEAVRQDGVEPERKATKPARTHWDMLLERRSIDDLEELLDERLALLRSARGEKPRRKSA